MSASLAAAPFPGEVDPSGRIQFAAFEIQPGARTLLRHGVGVAIGGRAFDLLLTLAGAPGRVVGKQDLMRRVWPGMIVEEANLRAQLRYLRRALGTDFWRVKTVPGRGYLLNVADEPGERADNDQSPPTSARAPVVIIDASAGRAKALHGLCSQAAGLAEPRQWAQMRITGGGAAWDGLVALAAHLRDETGSTVLDLAGVGGRDANADQLPARDGPGFSAMVMIWRAPPGQ